MHFENQRITLPQRNDASAYDLSIITVSYNSQALLQQCLDSIFSSQTRISYEVIVVDNASHDNVAEMLQRDFPQVKFIQNSENLGFSCANNIGIHNASGEYILLLNPDTQLTANGVLDRLVSYMQEHVDVGAAGGNLVYSDGHQQISGGYRLTPFSLFAFSFFLAKITKNQFKGFSLHPQQNDNSEYIEVDWLCAACMIVRRKVLETTGLLDESYFLYGEDIEWGCRMSGEGWRLHHIPSIKIEHVLGGTQKSDKVVSTVWLDGMSRVYFDLNPDASAWFYRLVFGSGLLFRALIYGSKTLWSNKPWFYERRRDMFAWARYVLFKGKLKVPV